MRLSDLHYRLLGLFATLAFFAILVSFVIALLATTPGGCAWMCKFRITNATGQQAAVTSGHTQRTIWLRDQDSGLVPHGSGDITVVLADGTTWVYRNLRPLDVARTAFATNRRYLLLGYEHGYLVRGSTTAGLLVKADGRMYAIPPVGGHLQELEQPRGFPVKPAEVKDGGAAPSAGQVIPRDP